MCFSIPLQVREIKGKSAIMEDDRIVMLSLLDDVKQNQWLLVKANLAVQKLSKKEALAIRKTIKELTDEVKK